MTKLRHTDHSIRIRSKDIPVRHDELAIDVLRFYADNPRVHSILRKGGGQPSQEEIEAKLLTMDHVKQLMADIKLNGGLIDPLVVKDRTFEVLEGNSRLAAYRELARKDPIKWGKAKCVVLPGDLEESLIFALLGQYHVKGKKAWMPYEQAGFLQRRYRDHHQDYASLGEEIGLSAKKVRHMIETYNFMQENGERGERWSYYDEYLKSSKIRKAREAHPELDRIVVDKIKDGEISRAVDVRDTLPKICHAGKVLKRFVGGKTNFDEATEDAVESGSTNKPLRRLENFKKAILDDDFKSGLLSTEGEARRKVIFELKKILHALKALETRLA